MQTGMLKHGKLTNTLQSFNFNKQNNLNKAYLKTLVTNTVRNAKTQSRNINI